MKIISSQEIKKVVKGALAIVLASTFTFSSLAFADDNNTDPATYDTVDLQAVQTQLESTQTETPSVIPGDFFYFAKIAFEKIKLAVTFDNSKEAELMATYASERLAEAGALYGEGKEAEALKVIQAAIEYIESSQSIVDETNPAETIDQDSKVDDVTTTTDENTAQDSNATVGEASDEQNSNTEVEDTLRHNITALSAAMEHVGNDKARASLQKISIKHTQKSLKKLLKLEKKYHKVEDENQVTEDAPVVTQTESPDVTVENPVQTDSTDTSIDSATLPESTTSTEVKEDTVVQSEVSKNEQDHGKQAQQQEHIEKKEQPKGQSAEVSQKQKENKGKQNK